MPKSPKPEMVNTRPLSILEENSSTLQKLTTIQNTFTDHVTCDALGKLIAEAIQLEKSGKITREEKERAFELTYRMFLDTQKAPEVGRKKIIENYLNDAQTMQGKPSLGMKILGGLMLVLGYAIMVLGGFTPPACALGGASALTGLGLFYRGGAQKGLCDKMVTLGKWHEVFPAPVPEAEEEETPSAANEINFSS